jgi:hypothetical protein
MNISLHSFGMIGSQGFPVNLVVSRHYATSSNIYLGGMFTGFLRGIHILLAGYFSTLLHKGNLHYTKRESLSCPMDYILSVFCNAQCRLVSEPSCHSTSLAADCPTHLIVTIP